MTSNDRNEIKNFLKENIKFLEENPDYSGAWLKLDGKYSVVLSWQGGYDDEDSETEIKAPDNKTFALNIGIKETNPADTPDYWTMPFDEETGELVASGDMTLSRDDDLDDLVDWVVDEYETIAKWDYEGSSDDEIDSDEFDVANSEFGDEGFDDVEVVEEAFGMEWKCRIPGKIRKDIQLASEEENTDKAIKAIGALIDEVEKCIAKLEDEETADYEVSDLRDELSLHEGEEFWDAADELDYILDQIYDLCDSYRIFIDLGESFYAKKSHRKVCEKCGKEVCECSKVNEAKGSFKVDMSRVKDAVHRYDTEWITDEDDLDDAATSIADNITWDLGYKAEEDEDTFYNVSNAYCDAVKREILKDKPILNRELSRLLGKVLLPPQNESLTESFDKKSMIKRLIETYAGEGRIEDKAEEIKDKLWKEVESYVYDTMPEGDVASDYNVLEVEPFEDEDNGEKYSGLHIQFRSDVFGFYGSEELVERLDNIVKEYDTDAYFEPYYDTVWDCYIHNEPERNPKYAELQKEFEDKIRANDKIMSFRGEFRDFVDVVCDNIGCNFYDRVEVGTLISAAKEVYRELPKVEKPEVEIETDDFEFEESLSEGAEGKKEFDDNGNEMVWVIYDSSEEMEKQHKAPIVAIRSTYTEAQHLVNKLLGPVDSKYSSLSTDKAPKGRFKKGDDFYGPFDQDWNLKESVELTEGRLPRVVKLNKENDLDYTDPEDDLEEVISDYLSDTYGYCHFGFEYVDNGDNVRVYNIKWDTSESVNKPIEEDFEKDTIVYNLECGVILDKDNEEFDYYSSAYDHKFGYYDETYSNGLKENFEELKKEGLEYVKNGVNGTYAILTEIPVNKSWFGDDAFNDIISEIKDNKFIEQSIDVLDGEQFKASNVVWSVRKDENGNIIEDFVDTSITESVKSARNLTEAPDKNGVLTDDEIEAEERAEFERRLADRKAKAEVERKANAEAEERKAKEAENNKLFMAQRELLKDRLDNITNDEDKLEELFRDLVPGSGTASSIAGEIVRAMMRLLYRDYNDGDVFYDGYGIKTCAQSANFIADYVPETEKMFIDIAEAGLSDDEYTRALDRITEVVVNTLMSDDEDTIDTYWKQLPEGVDSRNYGDEDSWSEFAPTYEYEIELSDKVLAHIEAGDIDIWDAIREAENWLYSSDTLRGAEVSRPFGYSDQYITIEGLSKDGLETIEGWNSRNDIWDEYGRELDDDYGDPEDRQDSEDEEGEDEE